MSEKELRKSVVGKNALSNLTLTLKIVFDLIPQALLIYLISSFITKNVEIEKMKYIFLVMLLSFMLKGMSSYFSTKLAHKKAYETLTELRQIGRASCRERCRSRWSPY